VEAGYHGRVGLNKFGRISMNVNATNCPAPNLNIPVGSGRNE
jgi:hypothetical protein